MIRRKKYGNGPTPIIYRCECKRIWDSLSGFGMEIRYRLKVDQWTVFGNLLYIVFYPKSVIGPLLLQNLSSNQLLRGIGTSGRYIINEALKVELFAFRASFLSIYLRLFDSNLYHIPYLPFPIRPRHGPHRILDLFQGCLLPVPAYSTL